MKKPKFKVGDRVRVVSMLDPWNGWEGVIKALVHDNSNLYYVVQFTTNWSWFEKPQLEKVTARGIAKREENKMSEQKTLNKFEAVAAMVRDGVKVKWSDDNLIYYYDGEFFCQQEDGPTWVEYDLPEGGDYTIYKEPPKMKTYYKVFWRDYSGETIHETSWYPTREEAGQLLRGPIIALEERQFPEVK